MTELKTITQGTVVMLYTSEYNGLVLIKKLYPLTVMLLEEKATITLKDSWKVGEVTMNDLNRYVVDKGRKKLFQMEEEGTVTINK